MTDIEPEHIHHLIGHEAQIKQTTALFESGKMHHAWLLTGPKGIGKSLFARQLAAAIISYDDNQSALFGEATPLSFELDNNHPDIRQVWQNAHPDFLYIAPVIDEKNKSGTIKVEQIRALTTFFAHKSAKDGWRVAIIDSLDECNVQGANAMLKIVEEPPEKTIIILLAKSKGAVLPTIRSRCFELKFNVLTLEEQVRVLRRYLTEADEKALEDLAKFANGSIGYALAIAETNLLDLYEASCLVLAKPQIDSSALLELSAKWGGTQTKALLPMATQTFMRLISDAALMATGKPLPAHHLDCEAPLLRLLCEASSPSSLAAFHHEIDTRLRVGERAFLDMPSVFMAIFDKIHSLAHPK